jgi:hypothetical protein
MSIEFATIIDDYDFSHIPRKSLNTLKDRMICTLLFERLQILRAGNPEKMLDNQTHWKLI